MTGQQLKNSILQMAVQGKLVPQDPNDEPASVLLERIRAEKERLIKEKKIKKEKNPSVIFRSTNNSPYTFLEKIGDEIRDISDEIPFDIPESWEWCRLNDVVVKEVKRGKSPSYADAGSVLVFAQKCNVKTGGINLSLAKYLDDTVIGKYPQEEYMQDRDIIVNSTGTGTLGRIGIYSDEDNVSNVPLVPDSHVTIVRADKKLSQYLYYILKYYQPFLEESGEGTTKQKELKPDKIKELYVPLPPLAEQNRIVAKIEELLPCIENYTEVETKLNTLNTTFPSHLKKSILQQAVQGKLVPQNPDDEPASVLLERIKAEKQELINAGKIKKDKNESVIFRRDNSHYEKRGAEEVCIDDELPYEIPESWEWSRLGSLVQVNPRNSIDDETDVGFIPMPLIKEGFSNSHSFETRKWKDIKSGFTHFADSDVVIAKITPCFQNRKSAIISELPNGYGAGTTELHVLRDNTKLLYTPYLLLICKTHDFIENGVKNFTGTAGQQRIGKDFVSNYLIPIPPYEEQKRIVNVATMLIEKTSTLAD